MNQAERLTEKMKEEGFVNVETMEVLVRNLEARVGHDAALAVHGRPHLLPHLRKEDRVVQVRGRVLIRLRERWHTR